MSESSLKDFSELATAVMLQEYPILPKPEWGQDAAFVAWTIDKMKSKVADLMIELDYDPEDPAWGTKDKSRGQLRRIIRRQHKIAKNAHNTIKLLEERMKQAEMDRNQLYDQVREFREKCDPKEDVVLCTAAEIHGFTFKGAE